MNIKKFKEYLICQGYSRRTIETHLINARRLPLMMTKKKAAKLIIKLREEGKLAASNNLLWSMDEICRYTNENWSYGLKRVRVHKKARLWFDDCQTSEFLKIHDNHDVFWRLMVSTGARVGELLGAKTKNFNRKLRLLEVETKTRQNRFLVIPRELIIWLDTSREYLFPGIKKKDQPLHYATILHSFHRRLEIMGIDDCGYTVHSFRRSFAEKVNYGQKILMNSMGHKSLSSTRVYLKEPSIFETREMIDEVNWTSRARVINDMIRKCLTT